MGGVICWIMDNDWFSGLEEISQKNFLRLYLVFNLLMQTLPSLTQILSLACEYETSFQQPEVNIQLTNHSLSSNKVVIKSFSILCLRIVWKTQCLTRTFLPLFTERFHGSLVNPCK